MNKNEWIDKLREIAKSNYDVSYGWQVFVECYDQKDWIRFVAEMSSFEEAEDNLRRLVALHDDQYADAQNEIL